jgi:hypothetical protein
MEKDPPDTACNLLPSVDGAQMPPATSVIQTTLDIVSFVKAL